MWRNTYFNTLINPLKAELKPICHLLVLSGDLTFMGPCFLNISQYIYNKMQRYTVYLCLETALHVSVGTSTHHQERIQLYLQHLVFVTLLLLSAAIVEELEPVWVCRYNCIYSIWYLSHYYSYLPLSWKSWNRFECVVGGVSHPQHTQTGSNSSRIAADRSNSVTNTRCCRYSCMRSWWWVEVPTEICRAVSRYK